MRRFILARSEDVSGISGIGDVAEGVVFGTGKVVIAWTRSPTSIDIYDSVEDLLAIHGHGGRTRIRWLDDAEPASSTARIAPPDADEK